MGGASHLRVYVQRGVLAERTNADLRVHRGLDRLNVRGLVKVKTVVLLAALSFNLPRLVGTGLLSWPRRSCSGSGCTRRVTMRAPRTGRGCHHWAARRPKSSNEPNWLARGDTFTVP